MQVRLPEDPLPKTHWRVVEVVVFDRRVVNIEAVIPHGEQKKCWIDFVILFDHRQGTLELMRLTHRFPKDA